MINLLVCAYVIFIYLSCSVCCEVLPGALVFACLDPRLCAGEFEVGALETFLGQLAPAPLRNFA